jgi:hypothetical protein
MFLPIIVLQHTTSTTSVFTSPDTETDPSRSVISMDQQLIVMYLSLKGLNLDTSMTGSQVHHLRSAINLYRRMMRFFSPLKEPQWNACFRSGWTDWRNVVAVGGSVEGL